MASSTIPPPRLARADPLVGSVINGKYRVISLVASGGMGKIYRGEQLVLGRDVALKVLHAQSTALLDDPSFKKRFFLEASILSRLQHPNIVTLFDYGAIEGSGDRYFMAMEFLAGETLMRRLYERVALTPRETVRICKQIARGLSEAHAHGIVHRDLKPSNVMLVSGRDGRELVKVLDFGIVKVMGQEEDEEEEDEEDADKEEKARQGELTQEGSFIGSPKYMAPEQIARGAKVDARTDIYSLGIILYQCLCGAVPFEARSSIETMMAHLNEEAIPLCTHPHGADVPEWLEQLVMSCIEKDPDMRPATMELVARVLEGGEATLSPSSGASGRFQVEGARETPDLDDDDPQRTNRYPTSMIPPRLIPPREGARTNERPSERGRVAGQSGRPSGSGLSARPSGSHPSGSHAITETGTAIGSLPPRESLDTGTHVRRVRMAPVAIAGAFLLGVVALLGERVISKSASDGDARRGDRALESAPKPTFRLIVESTPPGADVLDGDDVLGATPLSLAIDNAATRTSPRKLVLRRAGYEPYAILQGPSDDNVRILATLVAASPVVPPPHVEPHVAAAVAPADSAVANPASVKTPDPKADAKGETRGETRGNTATDTKAGSPAPAPPKDRKRALDIRLTR